MLIRCVKFFGSLFLEIYKILLHNQAITFPMFWRDWLKAEDNKTFNRSALYKRVVAAWKRWEADDNAMTEATVAASTTQVLARLLLLLVPH